MATRGVGDGGTRAGDRAGVEPGVRRSGEELTRLQAAVRAAAAGQPGMLLVAGEAGVGKSRLIERFTERAEQAGALVAIGGTAPLTAGMCALLYAPLLQALRVLADNPADDREAVPAERRAELAGVLAELTADVPAGQPYGPEAGRGRLFERLAVLLERLGRAGPLVLVLEDLHWADAGTLDFLAYLLRGLRRQRLLLIATYRLEDPGDRLLGWLAEARRSRLVGWLELARFTQAEVVELLVGLRGRPVDGRVVAEVFDRSEGNAFFAEELYAAGIGAGADRLPRLLREVLLARVRGLSPHAQRLLAAAAVAGRSAYHELLAAVVGGSDDELVGALREAVGCGLLQVRPSDPAGQEAYAFRHALAQEAIYDHLLPGERAALHEVCARALSTVPDGRQAAMARFPGELAEHWYRAGRPVEALDWALRAADSAERVYAYAEAARSCERALQLWDQVSDAAGRAGTGQERLAGWVACLGMRALADLAELVRARQDQTATVGRSTDELVGRVAGLVDTPFVAGGPLRATAPAERALWDAEQSRLDGTPDPAGWQAAAEAWQQLGRPYRTAYCRWRQAEALLASGASAGAAADPLRAAHATAAGLGAGPLRVEIEALARRARLGLDSAEAGAATEPVRPHDLTDRELAVLRMLAAGHTNREIGQRLFMSPKTASVHVTDILRKLAVRDRVQAAAVGVRLGLVEPTVPADRG